MRIRMTTVACALLIGTPLAACDTKGAGSAAPAAATAPAQAAAGQAEGAEAFMRALYAPYVSDGDTAHAPEIWSARTRALWADNARAADGGEGYMGADPICACQDFDHFQLTSVAVTPTAPDRADAAVVFGAFADSEPTRQTFKLVREDGAWRIDDIVWGPGHIMAGQPPMAEGLVASTAELDAEGA